MLGFEQKQRGDLCLEGSKDSIWALGNFLDSFGFPAWQRTAVIGDRRWLTAGILASLFRKIWAGLLEGEETKKIKKKAERDFK